MILIIVNSIICLVLYSPHSRNRYLTLDRTTLCLYNAIVVWTLDYDNAKKSLCIYNIVTVFCTHSMSTPYEQYTRALTHSCFYYFVLYENIDQILPNKLHGPITWTNALQNRHYMCIQWTRVLYSFCNNMPV